MKKIFFFDIKNINCVADKILLFCKNKKKFAFYGNMGVGKTTLIKALSLRLGSIDIVTSPTFSIVNEYRIKNNDYKIYHFDFYRFEDDQEVYDIGYEEYFYSNEYCFIEWPEKITSFIDKEFVSVNISIFKNKRKIEIII